MVELEVDPSVGPRLGSLAGEAVGLPSFMRSVVAELRAGGDGRLEVWLQVTRGRPPERLGWIPGTETDGYRRPLAAAGRVAQRCTCRTIVYRERDGEWGLATKRPLAADLSGLSGRPGPG